MPTADGPRRPLGFAQRTARSQNAVSRRTTHCRAWPSQTLGVCGTALLAPRGLRHTATCPNTPSGTGRAWAVRGCPSICDRFLRQAGANPRRPTDAADPPLGDHFGSAQSTLRRRLRGEACLSLPADRDPSSERWPVRGTPAAGPEGAPRPHPSGRVGSAPLLDISRVQLYYLL
jgi:hypothetical protein